MHLTKLTVGLLAAASVLAVGCAVAPKDRGQTSLASERQPPPATSFVGGAQTGPGANGPTNLPSAPGRAGSASSSSPNSLPANGVPRGAGGPNSPPPGSSASKPPSLQEVIAEVEALGDVNPDVQKRLLEELRNCDPALWPLVAQQVRAALAYQKQQAARAAGNPASTAPGPKPNELFAAAASGQAPATVARDPAARPIGPQTVPPKDAAAAPATGTSPSGAVAVASPAANLAATAATEPASNKKSNNPSLNPVQQVSYEQPAAVGDWNAHLAAAIEGLERQTREPAHDADSIACHAYLRLLYLAAGRRDDALRPIAGISAAQQDYWSKQLYALNAYLDSERIADPGRRTAEAVSHLSQAASKLGELGPLVVKNLTFCTEVSSYGVFKRFEHDEFKPGQQALLYAEVENFKSEETAEGFHTALQSSYQILDSQGRRVAQDDFPLTEEHCQNRRRDYFIRYFVSLPPQIYEGRYTLELTIEDTLGRKLGQSTIEFAVKGNKTGGKATGSRL